MSLLGLHRSVVLSDRGVDKGVVDARGGHGGLKVKSKPKAAPEKEPILTNEDPSGKSLRYFGILENVSFSIW